MKYSSFSADAIPSLLESGYMYWVGASILIGFAGAAINYITRRDIWVSLSVIFVSLLTFVAVMLSTTGYFHYLQLLLVPIILGAILIIRSLPLETNIWLRRTINVVAILPIVIIVNNSIINISDYYNDVASNNYIISLKSADDSYIIDSKELIDFVPVYERDQILGYNIPAAFYLAANIIPESRYFTLQDWWALHDSNIYTELELKFVSRPPKWLLTSSELVKNKIIAGIITKDYVFEKEISGVKLYRLK